MKEISKAKFPGLTEKMTDKIEKLVHCRFITILQNKINKSNILDEILSTLNTIRTIVSYFFDFFKDSYLALYLLVRKGLNPSNNIFVSSRSKGSIPTNILQISFFSSFKRGRPSK